jgi:uncharacterized protein (TIGR02271 family)
MSAERQEAEQIILLLEEQLRISKRTVETGRVQVRVLTESETAIAEAELWSEHFETKLISIGREISELPGLREEGDTVIIPVVEEILVLEKRLILKEEVHIRRVRSEQTVRRSMPIRRQRAEVARLPPTTPDDVNGHQRVQKDLPAMSQTITAMFKNRADAQIAKTDLETELGLVEGAVQLHAQDASSTAGTTTAGETGFIASLRNLFMPEEDRNAYATGIQHGGVLVSAEIDDATVDRAYDILDRDGAVNLDEQQSEWEKSSVGTTTGAALQPGGMTPSNSSIGAPLPPTPMTEASSGRATVANTDVGDQVIPIVEERLRVGKRDVERGRVRVRSYIVETPVEEQVNLRSEHVQLERRPVDRELTTTDAELFRERTIEATETSEEAVIAKDVRVKEELILRKGVVDNVETVRDTVRRTEVEVEDSTTHEGHAAAALKPRV